MSCFVWLKLNVSFHFGIKNYCKSYNFYLEKKLPSCIRKNTVPGCSKCSKSCFEPDEKIPSDCNKLCENPENDCKCLDGFSFIESEGSDCVKECRKYKFTCFFSYLKLLLILILFLFKAKCGKNAEPGCGDCVDDCDGRQKYEIDCGFGCSGPCTCKKGYIFKKGGSGDCVRPKDCPNRKLTPQPIIEIGL